jgi:septum formation protein
MTTSPFVPWPEDLELVLASASPRRAELLRVAGIPHLVIPSGISEAAEATGAEVSPPAQHALALAVAKAEAVVAHHPGRPVLGADTVVVLDGRLLEKPADPDDARRMLHQLSGRRHLVITAIALRGKPFLRPWEGWEETWVDFLPLADQAVADYVATGEPLDKAGAYGIQGYGALMVRRIEGCYFNVMGLPLALLGCGLREILEAKA